MDIGHPTLVKNAYRRLKFEEWPDSAAAGAAQDHFNDPTWHSFTTPGSFQGHVAAPIPRGVGKVVTIATNDVGMLTATAQYVNVDAFIGVAGDIEWFQLPTRHAMQPVFFLDLAAGEALAPSSAERGNNLNRVTCNQLISELEAISSETRWGTLSDRLRVLLDASCDPEEGSGPMQPASLITLAELIRAAPNLPRPALTLTAAGCIWLEWNTSDRERAAIECLPEANLRVAWIKRDRRRKGSFASRYGAMSVDELVSEEFHHASIWKRLVTFP